MPNIIQHGILPRETLYPADFDAYTGAEKRLDGDDQVVSLSISAASQKIFHAKTRGSSETEQVAHEKIIGAWACRHDLAEAVQGELDQLPGAERDVLHSDFSAMSNGFSKWIFPK